ncbi:MAG: hypothetical protein E4H14_11375, partial [Candidatus Thorarchaeota archaeon]
MKIQSGSKGIDFLVLENDDEMCGYRKMPIESAFCDAVKETVELLTTRGVDLLTDTPEIGCTVITALVQAQPGADAYRSRMFQYATDWGSEISPVAVCQRELFTCFRDVLSKISVDVRKRVLKELSDDLKRKFIFTYYWTSSDRHDSSSIRVID